MGIKQQIENLNNIDIRDIARRLVQKQKITKKALPLASLLVLLLVALVLWAASGAASRRLASDKKLEVRFERVLRQYRALESVRDELARRAALSPSQGILNAVSGIVAKTGLKEKMQTIKPLDATGINGFTSERAQVTFKGLTLNEMANLLYRIENAPMLLSIDRAGLRSSFAGPALDVSLVLALTKKTK